MFCQITHTGRHGENAVDRLPAWGPSAVPWVAGGEMPHAMTRRDMDAVRDACVQTAGLAPEAGFQGMELHLGHGHLLHQFLSPAANNRPDDDGGSLAHRLRYPLGVLGAVTAAVGDRAAVGIRVSVDDPMPGGLTAADQQQVVAAAVQVPGVAIFNASVAADQWPSIGHHVADMSAPPHPYLTRTVALRSIIGALPLLTANRYQTLDHAEAALEQGIDMVGMNRAHMADPDLIAKATSGRSGDIRPCVSGNFCIGQVALHRPISCMMNPRVGKEDRWPEYAPLLRVPLMTGVLLRGRHANWFDHTEPEPGLNGRTFVVAARQDAGRVQRDQRHGLDPRRARGLRRLGPARVAGLDLGSGACPLQGAGTPWGRCRRRARRPRPATRDPAFGPAPLSLAFLQARQQAGHPYCDDANAPGAGGVGPHDFCIKDGRRVSAATAFLRSRPDLQVLTGAHVLRVVVAARRAIGVEVLHKGERLFCGADETVLSGGAVNTPQPMMLSGLGPADALRRHGIDVVQDMPGVGRNLRDHLLVRVEHDGTQPVTLHGLLRPDRATGAAVGGWEPERKTP